VSHRTIREPLQPAGDDAMRVREAALSLEPDDQSLREWLGRYVNPNALRRIAFDLGYIRTSLPAEARIVEFGTTPPILTVALARLGYRVEGVDLDPDRFGRALAAAEVTVRRVDIETEPLPFAAGSFDAALFLEIFEHLRVNPIFTLGEVARVLKPGGTLFLSTPNLTSYQGLIDIVLRNRTPVDPFEQYSKLALYGHMGHVRIYTSKEICSFLEKVGFRVETVVRRGWLARKPAWKQRLLGLTLGMAFPRLRSHTGVIARRI
jgi:SAM-dependent methyltransferase